MLFLFSVDFVYVLISVSLLSLSWIDDLIIYLADKLFDITVSGDRLNLSYFYLSLIRLIGVLYRDLSVSIFSNLMEFSSVCLNFILFGTFSFFMVFLGVLYGSNDFIFVFFILFFGNLFSRLWCWYLGFLGLDILVFVLVLVFFVFWIFLCSIKWLLSFSFWLVLWFVVSNFFFPRRVLPILFWFSFIFVECLLFFFEVYYPGLLFFSLFFCRFFFSGCVVFVLLFSILFVFSIIFFCLCLLVSSFALHVFLCVFSSSSGISLRYFDRSLVYCICLAIGVCCFLFLWFVSSR